MHDAPDGDGGAGLEQGDGRVGMDAVGVVAQAPLQDTDAVHHRVDILETRHPERDLDVPVEVASHPFDVREDAGREIKIAPGADDGKALALKRGHDLSADEAVSPRHEAAHAGAFRLDGRGGRYWLIPGLCARMG
jgi:hypothetical protein